VQQLPGKSTQLLCLKFVDGAGLSGCRAAKGLLVAQHGVEHDEHLAHAGRDGDFLPCHVFAIAHRGFESRIQADALTFKSEHPSRRDHPVRDVKAFFPYFDDLIGWSLKHRGNTAHDFPLCILKRTNPTGDP
jgi:hypothetical protein